MSSDQQGMNESNTSDLEGNSLLFQPLDGAHQALDGAQMENKKLNEKLDLYKQTPYADLLTVKAVVLVDTTPEEELLINFDDVEDSLDQVNIVSHETNLSNAKETNWYHTG